MRKSLLQMTLHCLVHHLIWKNQRTYLLPVSILLYYINLAYNNISFALEDQAVLNKDETPKEPRPKPTRITKKSLVDIEDEEDISITTKEDSKLLLALIYSQVLFKS